MLVNTQSCIRTWWEATEPGPRRIATAVAMVFMLRRAPVRRRMAPPAYSSSKRRGGGRGGKMGKVYEKIACREVWGLSSECWAAPKFGFAQLAARV
jgi:hypothetical protein